MKIFLSHTHADKPVVEPIALRLREIFGEDQVFYDSWSIQPGDGIIEKMNQGLVAPEFVFFFVSEKSLTSEMVKLEWQNALYKATKGETKLIPIRVDGCRMPPVLLQSVYIDLFAHGVEATIVQIVNLIQGNSTFTPQHKGFSNLTYTVNGDPTKELEVVISASHLMEPNPSFALLTHNEENDFEFHFNNGDPHRGGFDKGVRLDNGDTYNARFFAPLGGAITPQMPMKVRLKATGSKPLSVYGVLHQVRPDRMELIPRKP